MMIRISRRSTSTTPGRFRTAALSTAAVLLAAGAAAADHHLSAPTSMPAGHAQMMPADHAQMMPADHAQMKAFHGLTHAVATLYPTEGNSVAGTVRFTAQGDTVHVLARLHGLTPNSTHGFHLHEFGDCSRPDGKSAGGHYNPEGHAHALPDNETRHAGDLGNLQADANGLAVYERTLTNVTIAGIRNPIIGRGVIVHALTDDGGQPTGNAGARIACGVIGIAKGQ